MELVTMMYGPVFLGRPQPLRQIGMLTATMKTDRCVVR